MKIKYNGVTVAIPEKETLSLIDDFAEVIDKGLVTNDEVTLMTQIFRLITASTTVK